MSLDAAQTESPVVSSVEDLVRWLQRGERKRGERQIGLEHEKLLYLKATGAPAPFEGAQSVSGIFQGLTRKGWVPLSEGPGQPVIALTRAGATLSLEPGCQLELSGAPHATATAAAEENRVHLQELREAAEPLGIGAAALGYRPFLAAGDQPRVPKFRYQMMRKTLGERGPLAHDMMFMTATGQCSLDWVDEADCAANVTLASRAAPLLVALFANSPLAQGKPTGFLSWRSRVWTRVDSARTGFPPHAVDGSFSYRSYVDWALAAPMLFLRRDGKYLEPKITFGQLLAHGHEGQPARESDWVDHLSTLFPEVRIKRVLEFRSADCCNAQMTAGLAALLRGLLYDPEARAAALELLPARPVADHLGLHEAAAREGLSAVDRGRPLAAWCVELLVLGRAGLQRLDGADAPLLDPLLEVAKSGKSPALAVLEGARDPMQVMAAASIWR